MINVDFTSMTLFKLALPLARAKILAPFVADRFAVDLAGLPQKF